MTDQTTAHPLRALLCRLLSGTCFANNDELIALREENAKLRAENEELRAASAMPRAENEALLPREPLVDLLDLESYRKLHAAVLSQTKPRGTQPTELVSQTVELDDEAEFDRLVATLFPKAVGAESRDQAGQPDHGDNWEFLQAAAQGVAAERAAFEAIADAPVTAASEDDFWASLPPVEDDEPITDAEIADTLGALFAAAGEIRAERLAAEAAADVAPEASDVAPEPVAAPEAVEPIEQGEPQPDVTEGWSERTVYGVTVSGSIQDKAWADWLNAGDLRKSELARLLRNDSYENRVATETANRMLQHSRAKAKVRLSTNAATYHVISANGYQLRDKAS